MDSLSPFYEVLIVAPIGRDAEAGVEVMKQAGINASSVPSIEELCLRLKSPLGAVLVAEEALSLENSEELRTVLAEQETWSNVPFILMTSEYERLFSTERIMSVFGSSGSLSILERPFKIITLVAAVQVALNLRKRQYEVRDLLERQNTAVKQRDEFLSIASHELKTPMTSLKLQIQMRKMMLERGDDSVFSPARVTSLLETADKQIDRLSRLVDDMLDISRIANGKLSLNLERVNLNDLVNEVIENFSEEIHRASCKVSFHFQATVIVTCDRYRIEQVMTNLISNSIKYGSCKPITITLEELPHSARLSVKDQGPGIAAEHQEKIFQRFERAGAESAISGLGLGLYITREILEMHRGNIKVMSTPGEGSTFMVELPITATV